MALTYTWKILDLLRGEDTGGVQKVVWTCEVRDTNGDRVIKTGETDLVFDSTDPSFVAYTDLTETQVLDWVWEVTPKADLEREANLQFIESYGEKALIGLPW
jgi:hypothetical protein